MLNSRFSPAAAAAARSLRKSSQFAALISDLRPTLLSDSLIRRRCCIIYSYTNYCTVGVDIVGLCVMIMNIGQRRCW